MSLTFDSALHRYELDGQEVPSVTRVLKDEGFIDTTWFTEWARTRGIYVHRIIEWHVKGELDPSTIDDALQGYLCAWVQFIKDTGFISLLTERPFASALYSFAGTADCVGSLGGEESIIDIKAGSLSPATSLQLAAYEILHGGRSKRFALQLKEDGKYSLKEFKDRSDRGIFLSALSCWWWKHNNLRKGE